MPALGSRTDVEVRLQQVRSKSLVCLLRFESLEAAIAGIGGGTGVETGQHLRTK
jgi:hypothetical protein